MGFNNPAGLITGGFNNPSGFYNPDLRGVNPGPCEERTPPWYQANRLREGKHPTTHVFWGSPRHVPGRIDYTPKVFCLGQLPHSNSGSPLNNAAVILDKPVSSNRESPQKFEDTEGVFADPLLDMFEPDVDDDLDLVYAMHGDDLTM